MAKTARNVKTAAVAVIAQTALFGAMGKAQGEGRAAAFRADPNEETMQAILDAAAVNLRALFKTGKKAPAKKPALKIVAKNEKALTQKAMVKIADATDAQIVRAYKNEFDKTLSTTAAMRKGLIKAGVKAVPAKAEKKPAKVAKKVSAKKPSKKVAKAPVDNTKAIAKLTKRIETLRAKREDEDDKAKRAKLLVSIREAKDERAALKAA